MDAALETAVVCAGVETRRGDEAWPSSDLLNGAVSLSSCLHLWLCLRHTHMRQSSMKADKAVGQRINRFMFNPLTSMYMLYLCVCVCVCGFPFQLRNAGMEVE